MGFSLRTTSYGHNNTTPYQTPYLQAAAAWDQRIGTARQQAAHWRIAALGALLLAVISTSAVIYMSLTRQVAAYVVPVNKVGMPGRIQLANGVYHPDAAQIGYFVGQVVSLVRSRSLDPVVLRNQWLTAYHFLAGDAIRSMNQYAARQSGVDSTGTPIAKTVHLVSILQRSPSTYQVRWIEDTYSHGAMIRSVHYTGLFDIKLIPPATPKQVFNNPLGVYITNFTWSQDFDGPVQTVRSDSTQ
jgi:type IV secretion system protein VirB5